MRARRRCWIARLAGLWGLAGLGGFAGLAGLWGFAGLAGLAGLGGCGLPEGDYFGRLDGPVDPTRLRWCNQGEPDSLDPARASSTASVPIVNALFAGLTAYGPGGEPVPSLATSWEIDEDLRTFTFHLRGDARWTTGRPVTAYDVAYSALRVAHPLTGSPQSDSLAPIKNAAGYLTRGALVLRRDLGPYRAGDVVEVVPEPGGAGGGAGEAAAAPPEIALRTASRELALRDLGAPAAAAYARVPPGRAVTLVMQTGGRATPPSPDGAAWAYVFDAGAGRAGVYGWAPAAELDGEPGGDAALHVRRVTARRRPGGAAPAAALDADERAARPVIAARGRDVLHSPDALGVRVPDARTIVFECADPTPYFLALTASRALRTAPIEAVSRRPAAWTAPAHIATSGPLRLTLWRERDRIELARSPAYWAQAEIGVERVTIYPTDDQAAATNLYFTGACDAMATNTIPSSYLPALSGELRGRPYRDYRVDPYLTVYFLWLQTERLRDRHLRRALALAIDRAGVPRFTHGGELPTSQLTPGAPIASLPPADLAACGVARDQPGFALVMEPGQLCYAPPPGLDYDPAAAARELLLARQDPSWREPLEYRYNAGSEAHRQIAEYLQAQWGRLGLRVELVAQEWGSLLADTRAGRFQIARLGAAGTVADTESEFLPLFRCGSPDNRGRYCSPEFERLMDEARGLSDRRARNAVLRRAEAVMLEDAPVIPIYVYTQKHLIRPYVRGYAINLVDQPSLWRVRLDPAWRP